MNIRVAKKEDLTDLTELMNHLGYPTTTRQLIGRLTSIFANPDYYTFVAELDGKVVGMAGLHLGRSYEYDGHHVRILAFVVDSSYRNKV
ncbi:GNAT family N-acetyltransferase [Cytobacillus purgationiresistens]|uniref:N-acetylglutamate synthase-like GNAT family acetyltransferase n=1 Tax=Cytobacillus purgationiresistens TaxID=863449 RepID=A0ABU0AH27_9BACI|nr:GNAT family N-acetyltransferase [Cytobacillus purgationiresistens]MDQ0270566.1 N-acetylglutamate synthase-like GNAT family acetyltransferase [Cytobacillus purgationiresistens]